MRERFGRKTILMVEGQHLHLAYHLASEWRHILLLTYSCGCLTTLLTVMNLVFQRYQKFYHIYRSDIP
jgi:hypothetical protein